MWKEIRILISLVVGKKRHFNRRKDSHCKVRKNLSWQQGETSRRQRYEPRLPILNNFEGAVGVLIFSHPADDGFMRGTTYPNGPWRPESSVQRGSVWVGEGDPLTPGWASTENAPRLNISQLRDEKTMLGWPIPGIRKQFLQD